MASIKYISLTILLLSAMEAWTQPTPPQVPWKIFPTGSNHTIFIKTTAAPAVDEIPLESGDAIGIFYDSAGTLACAGYTVWNNANTFITAYGADGTTDGLKHDELFKFRIWRRESNCVVTQVTASYVSGGVVMNTDRYSENGISELSALSGVNILKVDNFSVQVTQSTCIAGGKILVEPAREITASGILAVARDILTRDEFPSAGLEVVELPEAEYRFTIFTDGCALEWPETLLVSKDLNCSFPVISPNKDGVAEDYYIPYQGTAKIYDRYGVLMVQFPTPSTWNATDHAGQLLPMGTYIIICEGQKEIIITVVR